MLVSGIQIRYGFIVGIWGLLTTGCVSQRKLMEQTVYLNKGIDTAAVSHYALQEPMIQAGDLLQIQIISTSSSTNALFNATYGEPFSTGQPMLNPMNTLQQLTASQSSATVSPAMGSYQVSLQNGTLQLPWLGTFDAAGKTKSQLEKEIQQRAKQYLKEEPIVNIRFLNYRITFVGDVRTPGSFVLPSERMTLLDGMGLAGGLIPGADVQHILLIREENGQRRFYQVDLTRGDIFNQPYYYLKQNDVIYVPPTGRELASQDQLTARRFQLVQIGLTAINILVIILQHVKF